MYFNINKEKREWMHRNTMLLIEEYYKNNYSSEKSLRVIAMELMVFYIKISKENIDNELIDTAAHEIATMLVEKENKKRDISELDKKLIEIELKTAYTNLYELCLMAACVKLDEKNKEKSK